MYWSRRHFKVVVLPTLVVYQEGLPYKYLSSIRRFYAKMQHRNFGGHSVNKKDPLFGLWKPFFITSEITVSSFSYILIIYWDFVKIFLHKCHTSIWILHICIYHINTRFRKGGCDVQPTFALYAMVISQKVIKIIWHFFWLLTKLIDLGKLHIILKKSVF